MQRMQSIVQLDRRYIRTKHGSMLPPPPSLPDQPQVFNQLSGDCVHHDEENGQGRAVCVLPSGSGVEVNFAVQSYVAATGDPPVSYLGQLLLMEVVVFSPSSNTYRPGRVHNFWSQQNQSRAQEEIAVSDPGLMLAQRMAALTVAPIVQASSPPPNAAAEDYEVIITMLRRSSGHNYVGMH